jgi:CRISPR-associated endonuclease/helicase Cas3
MSDLTHDRFTDFFQALHGREPYAWQTRLARNAIDGDWPDAIDLPTGSGKTACIDIAIFALACQAGRKPKDRVAPRRIFFCVNRRVIVDEAYERARRIAQRLWDADRGQGPDSLVLREVAAALRTIAGTDKPDDAPPLDVLELRGGVYRDNRWARSAAQPTVICTTIDQLGSRLLFRGYGVSPNAAPIQAALVAYDSLILLDEAHISQPFRQTLNQVGKYLDPARWSQDAIGPRPMIVVPMTATDPDGEATRSVIRLTAEDRANESLNRRLVASKPASLHAVANVESAIVEHARSLAKEGPAAIGIMVNRVKTAKAICEQLQRKHPDTIVELVIGGMRPIDRDDQSERLKLLVGNARPDHSQVASFIVATQCLEVGADYDFDNLITECASLDALRQRFGRLNRGGREIEARAVIVVNKKDVKPDDDLDDANPLDPIYGNALTRTWNWLCANADVHSPSELSETNEIDPKRKTKSTVETRTINFGINALNTSLTGNVDSGRIPEELLSPSASRNAPVMLPAYVDVWCQTSPIPSPDPDVALFIHGLVHDEPNVQVCWRADLVGDKPDEVEAWCDIVSLLPPTSGECMSVPISRVRRWLVDEKASSGDGGDVLEIATAPEDDADDRKPSEARQSLRDRGVIWRGPKKSALLKSPNDLRPGDTLILPVTVKGWDDLGHIPEPASGNGFDVGERAFKSGRAKHALRLHPSIRERLPETEGIKSLFDRLKNSDDPPRIGELKSLLRDAVTGLPEDADDLAEGMKCLAKEGFIREYYPDGHGIVLTARKRIQFTDFIPPVDEGDDSSSTNGSSNEILLPDHTRHVRERLRQTLAVIALNIDTEAFEIAAERHDWGKADDRFQTLLRGLTRTDASLFAGHSPPILAKSNGRQSPREAAQARERAELPEGFRHEMLSVQFAERAETSERDPSQRDLILHLIAAHHGYARPFAPVVIDDDPPDVEYEGLILSRSDRLATPPHRLDSEIAERFWSLTRRYGWWGLAYLEALLRLADQQASADEADGNDELKNVDRVVEPHA